MNLKYIFCVFIPLGVVVGLRAISFLLGRYLASQRALALNLTGASGGLFEILCGKQKVVSLAFDTLALMELFL